MMNKGKKGRKGECPGGGFYVLFGVRSEVIRLWADVVERRGPLGKGNVERDDEGWIVITSGEGIQVIID